MSCAPRMMAAPGGHRGAAALRSSRTARSRGRARSRFPSGRPARRGSPPISAALPAIWARRGSRRPARDGAIAAASSPARSRKAEARRPIGDFVHLVSRLRGNSVEFGQARGRRRETRSTGPTPSRPKTNRQTQSRISSPTAAVRNPVSPASGNFHLRSRPAGHRSPAFSGFPPAEAGGGNVHSRSRARACIADDRHSRCCVTSAATSVTGYIWPRMDSDRPGCARSDGSE